MSRQMVVLLVCLVGTGLADAPAKAAGTLLPRADQINRRQSGDLRREQQLYRDRVPVQSPAQREQTRQIQHREREYQRQLQREGIERIERFEGGARRWGRAPGGQYELQRLRRNQESQRLNFRMRRPVR